MSSEATNVQSQPGLASRTELVALLINDVLTSYIQARDEGIAKAINFGDTVLPEWIAAKAELKQTNRADGRFFNPLRSIYIGETTHSALLGDLLNPLGSHGQGSLFLKSFLSYIEFPDPEKNCENWVVTVEQEGRIDILLRRLKPLSVVIIENKSNGAFDRPNQLYRYWYHKIYLPYSYLDDESDLYKRSFKIVYLQSDSSKKPNEASLTRPPEWPPETCRRERIPIEPFTRPFQDLIKKLAESASATAETNVRLTTFLQLYSERCQTL